MSLTDRPTDLELAAVDKIFEAYMACNAADGKLAYSWSHSPGVMGALADAGRKAWRTLGATPLEARLLWWAMCDGGSTAAWVVDLLLRGELQQYRDRAY